MSGKKLAFKLAANAVKGADHRADERAPMDQRIAASSRKVTGRKPDFPDQETARLNVFLPVELLGAIKAAAGRQNKSLSQFVADWARTL